MTPKELAEELHNAGLDAYQGYKEMGSSADSWNAFRLRIAKALLDRIVVKRKETS